MTVHFDKSFEKSIHKVKEKSVLSRIETIIDRLERSANINEIPNIKKLVGFKSYYRIRIGDYRLGMEKINENTILIILIAHRKDIYKIFP